MLNVVQVNQLAGTTTGTANSDVLQDVFEQVIGCSFGDVLSGGDGNDTITMGVDNDTHDFRNGEDVDTITDFTAGGTNDTITLKYYSGLGSTSFDAAFQARLSTVSGRAELALNGGDKIIFQNVADHTLLTASDFVFV